MATVAQLAARTLRKLGIAVVANADRPASAPAVSGTDIVARVMRQIGILVPEAQRPAPLGVFNLTDVAQRALRSVGVNPIGGTVAIGTVSFVDLAAQALRQLGVNPREGAGTQGLPVPVSQIALRALRQLGINPADQPNVTGYTSDLPKLGLEVLLKLAVCAPEETPSPQDLLSAEQRVLAVHDNLAARGMVNWTVNTVPDAAKDFYLVMAANLLAPSFGKPVSFEAYAMAESKIAELVKSGASAQARAEAHVASVHYALTAEGLVDWDVNAIPDFLSEAYLLMATSVIAPSFGKPENVELHEAGLGMVRRAALSGPNAQAIAEARLIAVHNEFSAEGLADWPGPSMPLATADAYIDATVAAMGLTFGKPIPEGLRDSAWDRMRRYVLSGYRGEALAEEKARAAHEDLNGQGLVNWATTAIPGDVVEDYVAMTASMLVELYRPVPPGERQSYADAYKGAVEHVRGVMMTRDGEERAQLKLAAVHEEMNLLGGVSWTLDAIPAAAAESYVELVASELNAEGGKEADPGRAEALYKRIRRLTMAGPAGQALAEQKIRAVHYNLDARGKVRWTLHDIPLFAEEPYVFMAAVLLAPEVGAQADPNWLRAAEMDLERIVSLPSNREPVLGAYF